MTKVIAAVDAADVRFPTSRELDVSRSPSGEATRSPSRPFVRSRRWWSVCQLPTCSRTPPCSPPVSPGDSPLRWLLADLSPEALVSLALLDTGYPAYTTTPGWLGYTDDKPVRLAKEAVADGFPQIKLKVGLAASADECRLRLVRAAARPNVPPHRATVRSSPCSPPR